jgi:hypothetical protein
MKKIPRNPHQVSRRLARSRLRAMLSVINVLACTGVGAATFLLQQNDWNHREPIPHQQRAEIGGSGEMVGRDRLAWSRKHSVIAGEFAGGAEME